MSEGLRGAFGNNERPIYYDKTGKPITAHQYMDIRWNTSNGKVSDYARIAEDYIGKVWVSTVWLGIDHTWNGPPEIFETMIFGGEHDQYCRRYHTEAEAIKSHRHIVENLLNGVDLDDETEQHIQ